MTLLALVRHAPTEWNEAGRIQGRTDIPLSRAGREAAARWHLPPGPGGRPLADFAWVCGPLSRTRQTAAILAERAGGPPVRTEPRLVEMGWGDWEGETLAALRERLGTAMAENEGDGLDFRPPGGESPREVQQRFLSWSAEVAADGRPVLAVTHKGLIRAVLALATGWDMRGKAPARLRWDTLQLFRLDRDGRPAAERLNLALDDAWRD